MNKVTILQGLPGSGKSQIAKKIVDETGNTKRLNKDDFRAMFDNSKWSGHNEKFILTIRNLSIEEALKNKFNVVVDDTNFHPKHIKDIKEIAQKYNAQVEIIFIDTLLEECIKRDLIRPNSVGEKVIRNMYNEYLKPKPSIVEYNPDLPDCYIFDIDGTLALKHPDRGYFDWAKVGLDFPNTPVVEMCKILDYKRKIFFFSGRDKICKEQTRAWLHNVLFVETNNYMDSTNLPILFNENLFMRPQGNQEDDRIIKKKMYEDNIRGKYNVIGVVDDRPKVCDMWRELGLPVFQVGNPNNKF